MKMCQIYNGASAYRESIYRLLDQTFDTDWVFGKSLGDIKLMDLSCLRGNVELVDRIDILRGKAYWQKGIIKYLFRPYSHYIILGNERNMATWVFLLLSSFFPKKKIYLWGHGQYGKEGKFKIIIERLFYSLVDGVFLYGNYAKNLMVKNGFDVDKLHVIHNSLSYDKQINLRNADLSSDVYRKHFDNCNPVMIFIGRLTKVKRLDLLLEALSIENNKGYHYNLVMIGDGIESEHLKQRAIELGLKNSVWFYGSCYDENVSAELVYNADLCVAPGNVGLTAIHSMMFGCPVITHNDFPWQMPEFEAIIDGRTGGFFNRNDVISLAEAIEKWIENRNSDRDSVREMCYNEIDTQWTPYFQIEVFKKFLL